MTLNQLAEDFGYIGLAEAAAQLFPVRHITEAEAEHLRHGRRITATGAGSELTAAYAPDGQLIALLGDIPAKAGASSSPDAAQAAVSEAPAVQAKPELVFAQ